MKGETVNRETKGKDEPKYVEKRKHMKRTEEKKQFDIENINILFTFFFLFLFQG
jgi:hypothetical protein